MNSATLVLRFEAGTLLLDGAGNLVGTDDVRVTRDLAAGTYFVVVKPLHDLTSSGAYTLSATAASPESSDR